MFQYKAGQEFHRLKLLEQVGQSPSKEWLMQCSCGSEPVTRKALDARLGKTKSCGCLTRELRAQNKKMIKPSVDLTDRIFGRLTVLRFIEERSATNRIQWECRCECGTVKPAQAHLLLNGSIKSCGCLKKEILYRGGGRKLREVKPTTRNKITWYNNHILSLRQLLYLTAAADVGSMFGASVIFCKHRASVQNLIRGLEQELGVELLQRNGDGVEPTRAGDEVIRRAKQMLELMEDIKSICAEFKECA